MYRFVPRASSTVHLALPFADGDVSMKILASTSPNVPTATFTYISARLIRAIDRDGRRPSARASIVVDGDRSTSRIPTLTVHEYPVYLYDCEGAAVGPKFRGTQRHRFVRRTANGARFVRRTSSSLLRKGGN